MIRAREVCLCGFSVWAFGQTINTQFFLTAIIIPLFCLMLQVQYEVTAHMRQTRAVLRIILPAGRIIWQTAPNMIDRIRLIKQRNGLAISAITFGTHYTHSKKQIYCLRNYN